MADTGENRQIISRTNAREAETVRMTTKIVSKERSAEKAADASFGDKKDFEKVAGQAKRRSSHPKISKSPSR